MDNYALSKLLFSPRATVEYGKYMSYKSCHNNTINLQYEKPPKYAISNGWAIGDIPSYLAPHGIDEVLAVNIARIRFLGTFFKLLVHISQ